MTTGGEGLRAKGRDFVYAIGEGNFKMDLLGGNGFTSIFYLLILDINLMQMNQSCH